MTTIRAQTVAARSKHHFTKDFYRTESIVTHNGHTFDVPYDKSAWYDDVLRTRHTHNRHPHLDHATVNSRRR